MDLKELRDTENYISENFKVLTKADKNGISDLVPMRLWPIQRHWVQHKTHRNVVVKNRQPGFSSGELADNSHRIFTSPYQRASIIAHDQETSEFLFQTFQRFYHHLPENIRPRSDWRSGTRMRFPDLDSYIYCDSAKSESLGIGRTLNIAHLSEVAKWPSRKAEELFADISQTVPAGGFITLESTPKGRVGLFHRLYEAAKRGDINYTPFFYPWWWDITCVRETPRLELTKEETELVAYVRQKDNMELSMGQIAFRREKIAELRDLFFQEYPENDTDCWLTSDVSAFDGVAIRRYLLRIQPGREDGNWTIWKDAIGGERYVIGVDAAAGLEKGDWSVASVLRVKTNEYVARIRGKLPPDLFAQEILRLGQRYNDAELGVEREAHGHAVLRILLEANYPNIYYHQDYDVFLGNTIGQPGWKTSGKTKPIMITSMNTALRADDIQIWSENFLIEASGYVVEGNVYQKQPGGDDDELVALMIAFQLRENMPIIESAKREVTSYMRL